MSLPTPTKVAGLGFYLRFAVCLSVFPHDISKTDAAKITKLDLEMFHDESGKPIYFGIRRSEVKITSHKNIAGVLWVFALLWVLSSYSLFSVCLWCTVRLPELRWVPCSPYDDKDGHRRRVYATDSSRSGTRTYWTTVVVLSAPSALPCRPGCYAPPVDSLRSRSSSDRR